MSILPYMSNGGGSSSSVSVSGAVATINNTEPLFGNFNITSGNGIDIVTMPNGEVRIQLYVGLTGSMTGGGVYEKGYNVSSVVLNWSYNKTLVSQTMVNPPLGSISPSLRTATIGSTTTTDTTFSVAGNDGKGSTTLSTSVVFRQRRWWGTSANTNLTSSQILNLSGNEFATSRAKTLTIDGNGQYIWFSYPVSFGIASFRVNGLQNTSWIQNIVSHTNAFGFTENYYTYRSTDIQNGTGISIEVY